MLNNDSISIERLKVWGLLKIVKREKIIDQLINNSEKSSQEKDIIFKNWCKNLNINSQNDLINWQKNQGVSNEEWETLVLRRELWLEWCNDKFKNKINSHYLKRKNQLDKVTYSLLRVRNLNLANELYLRIREGEASFEEIVLKFSEGPEKKYAGRIGPVSINQPHPLLSKLLQISEIKQLWPPKQLDNWWIVVRLEENYHAKLTDELKSQLALELGEEYLKQNENK